jgi:transcriptional regulator with XRE-family HTH domain
MFKGSTLAKEEMPVKFAEKLRELRKNAGLSEAKLAELSGVTFAAIHDYGLNRRQPSFSAVVKLANALGVTCEAFAQCEDNASPDTDSSKGKKKKPRRHKRAKE